METQNADVGPFMDDRKHLNKNPECRFSKSCRMIEERFFGTAVSRMPSQSPLPSLSARTEMIHTYLRTLHCIHKIMPQPAEENEKAQIHTEQHVWPP